MLFVKKSLIFKSARITIKMVKWLINLNLFNIMKKNYFRSFLFSSLVILGVTSINAQEKENLIKQKIAGSNGNPSLIVFNKSSTYNLSQAKQIFKEQLSLKQNDDF